MLQHQVNVSFVCAFLNAIIFKFETMVMSLLSQEQYWIV